jgi:hypothetical protein
LLSASALSADTANMEAAGSPLLERPHVPLAIVGVVLVWTTAIAGSGFSPLSLPFALWSTVPYAVLWIVGGQVQKPWLVLGAGASALAADLGIRASVFLWPRGSTAAIALVFSPAYITAFVMPIGATVGWLCGRIWRWHEAGRLIVTTISPIALGLLILGLARPELFPTTVVKRRALLERIGQPRVVTGAETFESFPVSTKAAWFLISNLDAQPGDELAIVEHAGADVIDSASRGVKRHITFGGEPGRLWGSFSTLVRMPDDRLVVAQTGGGFSRTLLQDLNGQELWEYRPNPRLAPDTLRPADLDGDGRVEFYASSFAGIARLDSDGREVWRRPTTNAALLEILQRTSENPAWIVTVEYAGRVLVWDENGRQLTELAVTAETSPVAVVDGFAGRSFIHGRNAGRAFDLQGNALFEVPLGEFTLSTAAGVRFSANERPHLAFVGSTDRDTNRYRLLIVDSMRRVVYDEVFDSYPRVLVARQADGSDTLFVSDARGLRQLRRR